MKPIKGELKDKIWEDVSGKVFEHSPFHSPVCKQIHQNLGWWDNDSLIRLKVINLQWNIGEDLDETD